MVRKVRAGQVVAAVGIGRRGDAVNCNEANTWNTGLLLILDAVSILVVKDLSDQIATIENMLPDDLDLSLSSLTKGNTGTGNSVCP